MTEPRPQCYDPKQALAACLRGGRLSHALLIEGSSDAAMTLALETARGAVCSAELSARPCGTCRDCRKAEKGAHPDILIYSGEGGARSFHIKTVREIRRQAHIRAHEASVKAIILRDVQEMTEEAQNALLKVMEEPPPGVMFLLTCENKAALLETVLSRAAVFSMGEGAGSAEDGAAEQDERAMEILFHATLGSELEALAGLAALERDRQGIIALMERMAVLLADAMLHGGAEERLNRITERAGPLRIMKILAIIENTIGAAHGNAGGPLLGVTLCARIRGLMAEC